ncbi:MAG: ROK family protein [Ignavibacteriaceae bacterium]
MKEKSILGVDIGGTNIRIGKIFNDKIIDVYSQKLTSAGSQKIVLEEIIYSIHKVFDNSVIGIGVGVPSVVKKILEDEFIIPVYINNDANCFVAGEKYFGQGKNYNNIVGLTIGTGLGAGIYANSKLYTGANCGAGEFGLLPYKDSDYEHYCSSYFFKNIYNTSGEEVYQTAKKGNKTAIGIFNEFGENIGNAISAVILSLDPEIIIIGGSISKSFKFFKKSMNNVFESFPYQNSIKNLKITVSKLSQGPVLGAAALYLENNENL